MSGFEIRPAREADLPAIARIQEASPEGVVWPPSDYLEHDCRVCVNAGEVTGFIATREVAAGEFEVLSLAVDPGRRRCGAGAALLRAGLAGKAGTWFLEVRESNAAALNLYRKLGFQDAGKRRRYYTDNGEDAVVMKLQSW